MALQDPEIRRRNMLTDEALRPDPGPRPGAVDHQGPVRPGRRGAADHLADPRREARGDGELRSLAAVRGHRDLQQDPPRLPARTAEPTAHRTPATPHTRHRRRGSTMTPPPPDQNASTAKTFRHRRADPRGRSGRSHPGQPARRVRHQHRAGRRRRQADRLPPRGRPGRRVAPDVPDRRRRRAGAAAHHAATHHADGQRQGSGAGQRRARRPGFRLVAAERLHPAAGGRRTAGRPVPVRPRRRPLLAHPARLHRRRRRASPPPSNSPTAPRRPSGQGISSAATADAASPASRWGSRFEGQSSPTRFLVIDVRNDPLGTPERLPRCRPGAAVRLDRAAARRPPVRVHDLRPRDR